MSYTNGTTHYNLPLTTGADKRDWSDTNQAFSDVDAALYGAVQDTAQAELNIDALETRMDSAEQNIATNTGDIAGLDTRVTTVEGAVTSLSGQVTDTRQDLEDMICAYNEASATSTHAYAIGDYFIYNDVLYKATQAIAIGDTIVPDTNCETTNVTTELLTTEDLSSDVAQLQSDMLTAQGDILDLETAAEHPTVVFSTTPDPSGTFGSNIGACIVQLLSIIGNNYHDGYKYAIISDTSPMFNINFVSAASVRASRIFASDDNTEIIDTIYRHASGGLGTVAHRTQMAGSSLSVTDLTYTAFTGSMSLIKLM